MFLTRSFSIVLMKKFKSAKLFIYLWLVPALSFDLDLEVAILDDFRCC